MGNKLIKFTDIAVLAFAAFLAFVPFWNVATSLQFGQHVAGPNWLMLITTVVPIIILGVSAGAASQLTNRNWKYSISVIAALIFFLGWVATLAIASSVAMRFTPQLLPSPSSTTIWQSFGLEWTVSTIYLIIMALVLRVIGQRTGLDLRN